MASEYCKFPHCECSMGAAERCKRIRTRPAPVEVNPLTSNSVDDKIVPDANSNAPAATDTGLVTVMRQFRLTDRPDRPWGSGPAPEHLKDHSETRELVTRSQAEELLAAKNKEIAELRIAILADDPDPMLQHGNFIEMAETLHRACNGGRERAEKAEAIIAELQAKAKDYREYSERLVKRLESEEATRSQAEELLAAKDAENAYLKELVAARGETIKRGDDSIRKLEADNAEKDRKIERLTKNLIIEEQLNAEKDERIKELDRCHEGTIDLCNQKTAQIEAIFRRYVKVMEILA